MTRWDRDGASWRFLVYVHNEFAFFHGSNGFSSPFRLKSKKKSAYWITHLFYGTIIFKLNNTCTFFSSLWFSQTTTFLSKMGRIVPLAGNVYSQMSRLAAQVHMYVQTRIQNPLVDRRMIYHNTSQGPESWFPIIIEYMLPSQTGVGESHLPSIH